MDKVRCGWAEKNDLFRSYHDEEWGIPVFDDKKIFEFLILETFQAGLSWYSVLSKRDGFQKAFNNFNFDSIADYDNAKIEALTQDARIIRNKLKIQGAVANAKTFINIRKEYGSFSNYVWGFINNKVIDRYANVDEGHLNPNTAANNLSKDLKKQGFKFVGATVVYSFMQAIGMINDHSEACWRRLHS